MKIIFTSLLSLLFVTGTMAQNVGIGTTTPDSKLTIKGDGRTLSVENSAGTIKTGFFVNSLGAYVQTHTNFDLNFTTNDGPAQMTLQKGTGNLGIGSTNPALAGLVVDKKVGGTNAIFGSNTNGGVSINTNWPSIGFNTYYGTSMRLIGTGYGGYMGLDPNTGNFSIYNGANGNAGDAANVLQRMTITHTGNVGIANIAPTAKLDVNGTMRLTDGSEADGRILTTDATGLATWKENIASTPNTILLSLNANDATLTQAGYTNIGKFDVERKTTNTSTSSLQWLEGDGMGALSTTPAILPLSATSPYFFIYNEKKYLGDNGFNNKIGYVYRIDDNTWQPIPNNGITNPKSSFVANALFFQFGDNGTANKLQKYNRATGTWSDASMVSGPTSLDVKFLGYDESMNSFVVYDHNTSPERIYQYDPTTDSWSSVTTANAINGTAWEKWTVGNGCIVVWNLYLWADGTMLAPAMFKHATGTWTNLGLPYLTGYDNTVDNTCTPIPGGFFFGSIRTSTDGGLLRIYYKNAIYNLSTSSWTALPVPDNVSESEYVKGFQKPFVYNNYLYTPLNGQLRYLNLTTKQWVNISGSTPAPTRAANTVAVTSWGILTATESSRKVNRYLWSPTQAVTTTTIPTTVYMYKKN